MTTQKHIKVKLLDFKDKTLLEPTGKMTKLFIKIRKQYGHQIFQEHINHGKVIVEKDFQETQENVVWAKDFMSSQSVLQILKVQNPLKKSIRGRAPSWKNSTMVSI